MRINKLLSNFGICSRKEANRIIEAGRVRVNGQLCTPGQWVELEDEVLIDGENIKEKSKIYIMLNKPIGVTCTAEKKVRDNIIEFMDYPDYIFPVGRLDKESQGLIILTNDGELANKILESENHHEKEYVVTVDKPLTEDFLNHMRSGVEILGVRTRPCIVNKETEYVFKIILTQGLNRQIRRMCKALGNNVIKLQRTRILSLNLEDLDYGCWRYIKKEELEKLIKEIQE